VVTGQGLLYWIGDSIFSERLGYSVGPIFKEITGREPEFAFSGFVNPDDDALMWSLARKDMLERPGHTLRRTAAGAYGFWAPWLPEESKSPICATMNLPFVLAVIVLLVRNLS